MTLEHVPVALIMTLGHVPVALIMTLELAPFALTRAPKHMHFDAADAVQCCSRQPLPTKPTGTAQGALDFILMGRRNFYPNKPVPVHACTLLRAHMCAARNAVEVHAPQRQGVYPGATRAASRPQPRCLHRRQGLIRHMIGKHLRASICVCECVCACVCACMRVCLCVCAHFSVARLCEDPECHMGSQTSRLEQTHVQGVHFWDFIVLDNTHRCMLSCTILTLTRSALCPLMLSTIPTR